MTWAADNPVPAAVQNNTIYIYILVAVFGLIVIITAASKYIPIVGKTIDAWTSRRRRTSKASKAADIDDLKRQVEHLSERVQELEGENERSRVVLAAHREWDYEAVEVYLQMRLGETPKRDLPMPPPPLYPPPVTRPAT